MDNLSTIEKRRAQNRKHQATYRKKHADERRVYNRIWMRRYRKALKNGAKSAS